MITLGIQFLSSSPRTTYFCKYVYHLFDHSKCLTFYSTFQNIQRTVFSNVTVTHPNMDMILLFSTTGKFDNSPGQFSLSVLFFSLSFFVGTVQLIRSFVYSFTTRLTRLLRIFSVASSPCLQSKHLPRLSYFVLIFLFTERTNQFRLCTMALASPL